MSGVVKTTWQNGICLSFAPSMARRSRSEKKSKSSIRGSLHRSAPTNRTWQGDLTLSDFSSRLFEHKSIRPFGPHQQVRQRLIFTILNFSVRPNRRIFLINAGLPRGNGKNPKPLRVRCHAINTKNGNLISWLSPNRIAQEDRAFFRKRRSQKSLR